MSGASALFPGVSAVLSVCLFSMWLALEVHLCISGALCSGSREGRNRERQFCGPGLFLGLL